jgi:thiamine-monophosphate kinase
MKKKTAQEKKSGTVASLGEFPLITNMTRNLQTDDSVVHGVGDDCAVLKYTLQKYQLFSTDMVIEDVHFKRDEMNPKYIGYKALARNISDIAAMGGDPTYAVVSIALPGDLSLDFVKGIYAGLKGCAARYGVLIIGGDTAQHEKIVISIAILGEVEKQHLVLRSGAKEHDRVFVTGKLGGSIMKKHYSFKPRIAEAAFLTQHTKVNAMIDISDGLLQDLSHILVASGVGCVIETSRVPISPDAFKRAGHDERKALQAALTDGEDFELLFTVSASKAPHLLEKWKRELWTPLTEIGSITKTKKVFLRDVDGQEIEVVPSGFHHFQ